MKNFKKQLLILALLTVPVFSLATVVVQMHKTTGEKKSVGSISFTDTKGGLLIAPKLHGLPPGKRGFHVHEFATCAKDGMAAEIGRAHV